MKKNILILGCKNYPAFSSKKIISGGMEVYVWELVKYLKNSFNFTIIAGYSHSDDKNIRVISTPLIGKFALQPISLCIYSFFIALWLAITGKKIDLVNAQTPLSGLISYTLKLLFGIPYVVSVHIFAAKEDHVGGIAKVYGFIEKVVLANADKVVSAGYKLKKYLDERYGFEKDHVVVINPGMDVVDSENGVVSASLQHRLEANTYKILFLGRLIEENGLLDLLAAIRMLREENIRLYITGNGNLEERIKKFIKKEQLQEKIILLGIVRGDDKQYLMRNVDLSVRVSCHEVFPVTYLESVSVGIPVVATPVGDTEYMASETGAITIVPVNNPEKVVDAIKNYMRKGPLPERIVKKAQLFIGSISWKKQAQQTNVLFNAVIAEKKER